MNTQEQEKTLLQEIEEKLQIARQELDEFAVQVALGKAEARDKYEEIRKSFLHRLNELSDIFSAEDKKDGVKKKIDDLESQLNAAQTSENKSFGEAIDKIFAALETVKTEIRNKIKTLAEQAAFDHEVEMFKLKLEILRLRFGLKKFEVKENFHLRMEEARKKIESLTSRVKEKIKTGKGKYTDFTDEAQLAYQHFRKALEALRD